MASSVTQQRAVKYQPASSVTNDGSDALWMLSFGDLLTLVLSTFLLLLSLKAYVLGTPQGATVAQREIKPDVNVTIELTDQVWNEGGLTLIHQSVMNLAGNLGTDNFVVTVSPCTNQALELVPIRLFKVVKALETMKIPLKILPKQVHCSASGAIRLTATTTTL